ncbi:hypothetical protein BDZ91DRAFT_760427 [Kalaharituber pfeilii]|nr:hypothetical protein BDZ91DRAFT_760427 [Kalaharituber pfeilii]
MPAFGDSYKTNNPYQQKNQQQQFQHQYSQQNPQRSVSPSEAAHPLSSAVSTGYNFGNNPAPGHFSTVIGVGSGGVGGHFKHRIYPKEFTHSIFKSTQAATASPLLAALSNPSDLFSRSFLSASPGTNSTAPSSVTGNSPPSSWPASYNNSGSLPRGIGGSVPHQRANGAYPSFEEHLSRNGTSVYQRFANSSGIPGDMSRLIPGDVGYACSFDTLDGDAENVLCFGWEGGIDVWKIGKGSLDLLGRLEGLSGGVKGAKILPTPQRDDPLAALRPLIVLTVQTAMQVSFQDDTASTPSSPSSSRPRSAASFTSSPSPHGPVPSKYGRDIEWQTSVEIYSLSTRERVAVLFTSPLEPCPATSMIELSPPPIWGGLRVEVGDNSIAVGVGLSGEVYLFTLISATTPVQTQPAPSHAAEPQRKGKKGKGGNCHKKSLSSPPALPPPTTEVRGEWVCQGKVWTTVQVATNGSFSGESSLNGLASNSGLGFFHNGTPVFSLEGRWLAYSPPPANSSISAGGVVKVSHGLAASSVMTPTPPAQPPVNTQIDVSDGEEKLINRITREATQEVIRGAKWVGEHGMKAWQSYWNGSGGQAGNGSQSHHSNSPLPSNLNGGVGSSNNGLGSTSGISALGQQLQRESQLQQMGVFSNGMGSPYLSSNPNPSMGYASSNITGAPSNMPANNGAQPQPGGYMRSAMHSGSDPIYVSILDLGRFPSSADEAQMLSTSGHPQLAPFATFHPPLGVGYLSFAPGGLALLTVSSKGDVYYVWDLMRSVHKPVPPVQGNTGSSTTAGIGLGVANNRFVRQIARFTRMTVARTVDVSWSFPRGDKLAVLTDRGTVHFYDLPYNAYQWPPYKKPPPSSASINGSQQAAGVVQAVQGAVSLLGSSTQPLLTAARRRRPSNTGATAKLPSPTGGIFVNYGNSRSREVNSETAGSSGGSKGSSLPRGVDKVPLPGNPATVLPGSVQFLVGKEKGKVALMGAGLLHIYQKTASSFGGSKKRRSMASGGVLLESGVAYDLPGLPDNTPAAKKEYNEDQLIDLGKVVSGYWNGKHSHRRQQSCAVLSDISHRRRDDQYLRHPLSFAEIETTPAYPAFHTDRRVTLMVFSDVAPMATTSSTLLQQAQVPMQYYDTVREDAQTNKNAQWVFGLPMKAEKLNLGSGRGDVEFLDGGALEDVADAMESRLKLSAQLSKDGDENDRAVGKSRRKKRGNGVGVDGDGFFEDDCVLDFSHGM